MKIKIESDVFDIVERLKEIDDGYFILFDLSKYCFEIHNKNQLDSYCFTSKYRYLCSGVLLEVYESNIRDIDKIIEDIDNNNNKIHNNQTNKIKDLQNYQLTEIYKFLNNSSKSYNSNKSFSTIWS